MSTKPGTANNETAVRELINGLMKAVSAKNIDDLMACYAPDTLMFDIAPPLQSEGRELVKKSLTEWFPTWEGPIRFEIHNLRVTADQYIAYATGLQRIRGTKMDGEKPDIWFRSTFCLKIIDGAWRIAHEHTSTPFYMDGSNRAAVDLKP
ncbi:MAG: SgcJ/EcaC family oxidoreductase [Desulfosarcina sp.]